MNRKTYITILLPIVLGLLLLITRPVVASSEDIWVEKSSMQGVRSLLMAATVNGKIYAIGGSVMGGGYVGTNEEYNPETNSWTYKTPMPTPRDQFAIAVFQNKIYCIGGWSNHTLTGIVEVYDPATDTWESKTEMPAHTIGQANVVDGKIYHLGSANKTFLNQLYNPETDSWTTKSPLPTLASGTSTVFNNKIYFFGGFYNSAISNYTSVAYVYDPLSDQWSPVSTAPTFFMDGIATATSGIMAPKRIYVFEEVYTEAVNLPDNPSNTTLVYNPVTDDWDVGASIPENRLNFGVATLNDTFYVIGGLVWVGQGGVLDGFASIYEQTATNEQYLPIGYGTPDPSYQAPSPSHSPTTALSPTPNPTATPTTTQTPLQTATETPTPSPSASQQPAQRPENLEISSFNVWLAVGVAVAVAAVLAVSVFVLKRRSKP